MHHLILPAGYANSLGVEKKNVAKESGKCSFGFLYSVVQGRGPESWNAYGCASAWSPPPHPISIGVITQGNSTVRKRRRRNTLGSSQ